MLSLRFLAIALLAGGSVAVVSTRALSGSTLSHLDQMKQFLGSSQFQEDFERFDVPISETRVLCTDVINSESVVEICSHEEAPQGPNLVVPGVTFTAATRFQWNGAGYFGQPSKDLTPWGGNRLSLDFDGSIATFGFERYDFSGAPRDVSVRIYAADDVTLLDEFELVMAHGQFFGYENSVGVGSAEVLGAYAIDNVIFGGQVEPLGSCCDETGSCSTTTQVGCNGAWTLAGTCDPNPCPPPTLGACCLVSGECIMTGEGGCYDQGGFYQGDGTVCEPNPCPQPQGACCFLDGSCTISYAAECTTQGGIYQGHFTVCHPNPCTQPTGACCFPTGICAITTVVGCYSNGGIYNGHGTDCSPNPCPQPPAVGACCFPDGWCATATAADCSASGGTYYDGVTECYPSMCECDSGGGIDSDGDGLCDFWEVSGVPIAGSKERFMLRGANPLRKDLFVEVDALVDRSPNVGALDSVVAAFANAPVSNPNGVNGIALHIPGRNGDPSVDDTDGVAIDWPNIWADFDTYKGLHFGTAAERSDPDWIAIRAAKEKVFRYCVFGHTYGGSTSSGQARSIPGDDFLVTLGAFLPTTVEEEAGTFMHEFGHTLGLRHGGGDDIHGKPNYYSVMNYLWQMPIRLNSGCGGASTIPAQRYRNSWALNYSATALPNLIEASLSEPAGIGGNANLFVPVGPPTGIPPFSDIVPMGGPVNWDRIGQPDLPNVDADLNYVPDCIGAVNPSPGDTLNGFNDWAAIQYAVPQGALLFAMEQQDSQQLADELTLVSFLDLGALRLDCNRNGTPDADDIADGRSQDADGNGVPDECDAGVVAVPESADSRDTALHVPSPMPVGRPARITFNVASEGRTVLRVYDVAGVLVSTLVDRELTAGGHSVTWDGNLTGGRAASAGVYFVKLSSRSVNISERLVLIR